MADRVCRLNSKGQLIGPWTELVEQRLGVERVSTFDGGSGVTGHSEDPRCSVQREIETCNRELLQELTRVVGAAHLCVCTGQDRTGLGNPWIVVDRLLDEWDELAQRSALKVHDHELCIEEQSGVGLAPLSVPIWSASVANCSARSVSPAI